MDLTEYKYQVTCLNCFAVYFYREYPPYGDCFNCKSTVLEVKRLQ